MSTIINHWFLTTWAAGIVLSYFYHNWLYSEVMPFRACIPEDNFKEYHLIWYVHFDEQWKDTLTQYKMTRIMLFLVCFGSFLTIAFGMFFTKRIRLRFKWRYPRLIDKEGFRILVETKRLMDPDPFWRELTEERRKLFKT